MILPLLKASIEGLFFSELKMRSQQYFFGYDDTIKSLLLKYQSKFLKNKRNHTEGDGQAMSRSIIMVQKTTSNVLLLRMFSLHIYL
jgi:uncharacterized protein (DUF1330 family)